MLNDGNKLELVDVSDEKAVTSPDRRKFLGAAGTSAFGALLGMNIPFGDNIPKGLIPVALADGHGLDGKEGLTILNDRPVNAETPAHLLDDGITPTNRHFIRNNGLLPDEMNPDTWQLVVDGFVDNPMTLSISELKEKFETHTMALTIECGGNGRFAFDPPAKGNQWTYGAVACSEWTGVKLKDVLNAAGVQSNAVYTAHEGADPHLSGSDKFPLSRGLPIDKAMTDNILIAFEMNGEALHPMNGAPLRLVVPGWPGSCSQKWLTRIWVRDQVHDGTKMTGTAYRVPKYPAAPGEKVAKKDFVIIERMPVKSLVTNPATNSKISGDSVEVRGHAWSGDRDVRELLVSIDFGATWQKATLDKPINSGAWQNWRHTVHFPQAGYYEIWARAIDDKGETQPHALAWNPKGYLNNTLHRVAVNVG